MERYCTPCRALEFHHFARSLNQSAATHRIIASFEAGDQQCESDFGLRISKTQLVTLRLRMAGLVSLPAWQLEAL